MRTHMLIGLAIGTLAIGTSLTLAGLHPDVDNPSLSRLGLLIVLISIPLWNAAMLRRARLISDDQADDAFQAGYHLHARHVGQVSRQRPRPDDDDTPERHGL